MASPSVLSGRSPELFHIAQEKQCREGPAFLISARCFIYELRTHSRNLCTSRTGGIANSQFCGSFSLFFAISFASSGLGSPTRAFWTRGQNGSSFNSSTSFLAYLCLGFLN